MKEIRCLGQKNVKKYRRYHGTLINDYFTVNISSEGKISIEDHETGRIFNHILKLIDEADVGDNYRQRHPNNDKIIDFSAMQPKIHRLQDDSFIKIYTLTYEICG